MLSWQVSRARVAMAGCQQTKTHFPLWCILPAGAGPVPAGFGIAGMGTASAQAGVRAWRWGTAMGTLRGERAQRVAAQVGVAGRTGCGKSTLFLALYRIGGCHGEGSWERSRLGKGMARIGDVGGARVQVWGLKGVL